MDAKEPSDVIKDHGTIFDRRRSRIRCNYCRKLINGFRRLKFHLEGVRGDGKPCPDVPETVKELYRNEVFERKRNYNLKREVLLLDPPEELPLKRNCSQRSNSFKHTRHESGGLIDFSAANLPSFQEIMFSAMGNSRFEYTSYCEPKEQVPHAELTEMQDYVKRVKESWSSTGCSILLDTWRDKQGRDLVIILADCPQGPIYIKSCDVTSFADDLDALVVMLNEVVGEVGPQNVVQIVACSTAAWLRMVDEQFMDKCGTGFWTVCASHCINLMLEKLGLTDSVQPVLEKAVNLAKFMFKDSFCLLDITGTCFVGTSAVIPFMTLENIVAEKEKLEAVVTSPEWEASVWASTEEGKRVYKLVKDTSFWNGAKMVLKVSAPLVRLLALIHRADKPDMGYIYEAMDQVKEAIKKEFKEKKSHYMPFWKIIDEIWDGHLHTPLHAAGYYLNPNLFYSSNFHIDTEVAFGLLCSIVRLVQDEETQDLISLQLDKYRRAEGAFGEGSSAECRGNPPSKGMNLLSLFLKRLSLLSFSCTKRQK